MCWQLKSALILRIILPSGSSVAPILPLQETNEENKKSFTQGMAKQQKKIKVFPFIFISK